MDFKTILIIIITASVAAFFIPTAQELQSHFKSGQDYYASKDYRRAIEQYEWIINTDSKFLKADSIPVALLGNELVVGVRTAAYYQKGNALRNLGKREESIESYRIVERRPDSPKLSALAQFQIYETYYADKEYRKAIDEARLLVERHPLDERVPRAWYDIGWSFRSLGFIDSSNLAFQTLTQNYPKNELDPRARYQLAQNYFDQAKWDTAVASFQDIITRYRPESFASTEWQNVELKAVKDQRLFEAQAGRDVDVNTLELVAKSQVKIADAYQRQGRYDDAMQTYRKVIATFSLMPSLVEATYIKMATYTIEVKSFEEGIQVYRKAIDENFSNKPLQAKLQYKIARTYQDAKAYDKAAHEYLFYVQAFAPQANGIKFPVEQAYFVAISSFYSARDYRNILAYSDTMMAYFPQTEYTTKITMYRGLADLALGKYESARESFARVIEASPGSNESIVARTQMGKSYFDEKNYKKAVESLEQLLTEDQTKVDKSEIHYLLGLSHYGVGEYDKSIEDLVLVDSTSPYYPFTFARVTRAYSAQQRYDDAAKYLDNVFLAAKTDSVDSTPFVRLARSELYTSQQKYGLAAAEFDSVLADKRLTENTQVQARYGRGLIYCELAKYKEAAEDLQFCISSGVFEQVFPALVPQAKEKLAFSYINLGKKKEGSLLLNELIASAATELDKSKYLGMMTEFQYRSGDYQKSIDVAKQVLSLTQKDEYSTIRSYVAMSNSYGNLQQHDKAIATLKEAGEKFPGNSYLDEVFFGLGKIYYNAGDYKNGSDAFQSHLQRFPTSKFKEDAQYFYALSLYQTGKADTCIKLLREFLGAYPSSKRAGAAQMQIAEAYFNTTRFDEATKEYQQLYRKYPQDENAALAMFNEGWSYYQLHQQPRMLESFKNLVIKHPATKVAADAQFAIGDFYYNQKSYDSALTAYQQFVTLFSSDSRIEEAKTLIKDLSQVEAYKAYETAMAFFDSKNWSVAVEELTKVATKYPNTEIVYGCKTNIASAYEQLGERKKALAIFEEIIRDWKDLEPAKTAVFFAEMHKRWIDAGK
jgi:tetratricopeptide (TPR) repeat protein